MAKREETNEKRRQDILSASLELFVEKGFAGTTVRDISAATGTSNGLLFHYFPTKDDILEALVGHAMEGVEAMARLLSSPLPPLEIFTRITETILSAYRGAHGRRLFLLISQVKSQSSVPEAAKEAVNAIDAVKASEALIRKGQEDGVFRGGDPLSLAIAYWGAIQGIGEALCWYPDAPMPDPGAVLGILRAEPGEKATGRI
jgi:AcrR family transcriptional regulator